MFFFFFPLQVSQASEDVFTLLAPALPSQSAVDLLSPMVATEKHPMLLGTIKLFTKVSHFYLHTPLVFIDFHCFSVVHILCDRLH